MTANILGGAMESPKWIRKLEPSATVYSWALNNHWHTNFALSQGGKIQFRYRVLPHEKAFDAATSNRFGMEQIQPLIASVVDSGFQSESNLQIKGDPSVVLSVMKTINDGRSSIIRLRSVSDKDQTVTIEWKSGKPKSMAICHFGEELEGASTLNGNNVVVPAMGFITLRTEW